MAEVKRPCVSGEISVYAARQLLSCELSGELSIPAELYACVRIV